MKGKFPYLAILPVLIPVFLFTFYPILYAGYMSVYRYQVGTPQHDFIGLQNYFEVLSSYYFVNSLRATLIFAFSSLAMIVPISIGAAALLNENFKGQKILVVLILLPWAVPSIVSGIMWKFIYNASYGVLNYVLLSIGLIPAYQQWLLDPTSAMVLLINTFVWTQVPMATLLILTLGFKTIPKQLYEAAKMDGAGFLANFRHITLPFLKPALRVVCTAATIAALTQYDLVYVLTFGGPYDSTALISLFAYREAFTFMNFGHGTAIAFMIAGIALLINFVYFKILPRKVY